MKYKYTIYPSSYVKANESIFAYGGIASIAPHIGETTEEYRNRHMELERLAFEAAERKKQAKSPRFRKYIPKPFEPTQEVYDRIDALVEKYKDRLDLPVPPRGKTVNEPNTQLENCPYCGGIVMDDGRCGYCGSKIYNFGNVNASKKISNKLNREIYEYLDELGGYVDYDGKIESLMDDFGLDKDTAEGYVWNHTSGLDHLNGLR